MQAEQSQRQPGPPRLCPPWTQGGSYPEQQGERLRSAGALCKARHHPVHCKLQDLIQLLPWGHRRDKLSHFPASSGQGCAASCPAPLPAGCLFTSPAKHLAAVVAVKGQLQEQLSASSSRSSRSC